MAKILVVSDDKPFIDIFKLWLKKSNHQITVGSDLNTSIYEVEHEKHDIIIIDMPRKTIKEDWLSLSIFVNGLGSPEVIVIGSLLGSYKVEYAIRQGVWDCFFKPSRFTGELSDRYKYHIDNFKSRLLQGIDKAVERKKFSLPESFNRKNILGDSDAILVSLTFLAQASKTLEPILILGETGTGKELFAKAAHDNSSVSGGPFRALNCAAIPDNMIESELFGYKKGAFTDAVTDHDGEIKMANGGTLFLDEIGDLSFSAQTKLLRFLEEKEFKPLGATEFEKVNIRLIAATNQDLEERMRENKFRNDLYNRINTFIVDVPPLRKRRGDIRQIVLHTIEEFYNKLNVPPKKHTEDYIEALEFHTWPGNVRQLINVVKASIARTKGDVVDIHSIPVDIRSTWMTNIGLRIPYGSIRNREVIQLMWERATLHQLEEMPDQQLLDKIYGSDQQSQSSEVEESKAEIILPQKILSYDDYCKKNGTEFVKFIISFAKKNGITQEEAAMKYGLKKGKYFRMKKKFTPLS